MLSPGGIEIRGLRRTKPTNSATRLARQQDVRGWPHLEQAGHTGDTGPVHELRSVAHLVVRGINKPVVSTRRVGFLPSDAGSPLSASRGTEQQEWPFGAGTETELLLQSSSAAQSAQFNKNTIIPANRERTFIPRSHPKWHSIEGPTKPARPN